MAKLTKKAFQEWLRDHPDDEFEGRNGCNCPVAKYLRDTTRKEYFVGIDEFYLDDVEERKKRHDLPIWAMRFIEKVDKFHDMVRKISGEKCLILLEECK